MKKHNALQNWVMAVILISTIACAFSTDLIFLLKLIKKKEIWHTNFTPVERVGTTCSTVIYHDISWSGGERGQRAHQKTKKNTQNLSKAISKVTFALTIIYIKQKLSASH